MKKFIEFLRENNAWENFEKNLTKKPEEYIKEVREKGLKYAVRVAFTWLTSDEGFDYWNKLSKEWENETSLSTTLIKLWEND